MTHAATSTDAKYNAISVGSVAVTVSDDDAKGIVLSRTSLTLEEGDTTGETYTVRLAALPGGNVSVAITGQAGTDLSLDKTSLTFTTGNWGSEQIVTVVASDDTDAADDSATLTHTASGGGYDSITKTLGVTAEDGAPGALTVNFGQGSYTAVEDGTVSVKVVLSADPERTVTILLTKSLQGGASNSDYSGVPGSVTFSSGETEKTFEFSAEDDDIDDDGESVKIGFGSMPSGVSTGTTSEATVSITDDDTAALVLSKTQLTAAENGSDTFTVKLATEPTAQVTVSVSSGNTGAATVSPATRTFGTTTWNTDQTITVSGTDDDDSIGETVTVTLSGADGGYGDKTGTVSVSVTDDDAPDLAINPTSLTVGEAGSQTFTVKLVSQPSAQVTVTATSGDPGKATVNPGSMTFTTVNWSTSQPVTVSGTGDADTQDETLNVTFAAQGGDYAGETGSVAVSVTDDDDPAVKVSFGETSYTVAEGGSVTVKVKLGADPERTLAIPLTKAIQDGAADNDYSGVPANITFNSGDTEKTFSFSATQDSADDDGESVKLTFAALPADVSEGTNSHTVVSITDDDVPSANVSFEQASYTVAEGSSVTVKVKLSADPERTVTIPLTKSGQGGATAADYSGVPVSVVFNSGDTEKTFNFAAASDTDNDDGESVKLGFGSTQPAGVSAGSTAESVVSITDDDLPSSLTVQYSATSYSVTEGGDVEITVSLSTDPERTIQIPLSKANQGGASDSDYSGVPASITFNGGDTQKSFTISAAHDKLEDTGESVKLGFGTMPTGVSTGTNTETTVSIANVSAQTSLMVSYEAAAYCLSEGGTATITVNLNAASGSETVIPIGKTEQGGATSADYSGVPDSLTFGATDTSKTFTFSAAQDTADDDGESVKLGFGTLPAGVSTGTNAEATVSITDDDVPSVSISFEQASYTAAEGSSVTVKVKLDEDPERTVVIPLTKTNQDGATGSDYSGVPANVTFDSGDTEKTFSFSAASDTSDDDGESVLLGFGATLPTGVSTGTTREATVNITDDDLPQIDVSF